MGRFSVSNPVFDDYCVMEKYDLTTPNIDLLLKGKPLKERKSKKTSDVFAIDSLDYTQNYAIKKAAELPNMVIYGPPGTGKSQTIVNVIGDALCKREKNTRCQPKASRSRSGFFPTRKTKFKSDVYFRRGNR